jgi:hypothetical protein
MVKIGKKTKAEELNQKVSPNDIYVMLAPTLRGACLTLADQYGCRLSLKSIHFDTYNRKLYLYLSAGNQEYKLMLDAGTCYHCTDDPWSIE